MDYASKLFGASARLRAAPEAAGRVLRVSLSLLGSVFVHSKTAGGELDDLARHFAARSTICRSDSLFFVTQSTASLTAHGNYGAKFPDKVSSLAREAGHARQTPPNGQKLHSAISVL